MCSAEPSSRALLVRGFDGSRPTMRSASSSAPPCSSSQAATKMRAAGTRRSMPSKPQSDSSRRLPALSSARACSNGWTGNSGLPRAMARRIAMSRVSRRSQRGAWRTVSRKLRPNSSAKILARVMKTGRAWLSHAPPGGHRYWLPRPLTPSMAPTKLAANRT
ncbi:hypothetical protein D3C78_1173710 [compost metagenome]